MGGLWKALILGRNSWKPAVFSFFVFKFVMLAIFIDGCCILSQGDNQLSDVKVPGSRVERPSLDQTTGVL